MKRSFEIEWPDDCGPLWMNASNLLLCLVETCRNTQFTVRDVTSDGNASEAPETAGPLLRSRFSAVDKQAIVGAVARGWCAPENSHKVMDPDLADAIANSVFDAIGTL